MKSKTIKYMYSFNTVDECLNKVVGLGCRSSLILTQLNKQYWYEYKGHLILFDPQSLLD